MTTRIIAIVLLLVALLAPLAQAGTCPPDAPPTCGIVGPPIQNEPGWWGRINAWWARMLDGLGHWGNPNTWRP